jgi:hypothetical protein
MNKIEDKYLHRHFNVAQNNVKGLLSLGLHMKCLQCFYSIVSRLHSVSSIPQLFDKHALVNKVILEK